MNSGLPIFILSLLLAGMSVARTWTSTDGKRLEAEFVSLSGDEITLKRDSDGREFTLPLTRLSEADQNFVKEKAEEKASEPVKIEGEFAHLVTGGWELAEFRDLPYAFYGAKDLDGSKKYPLVISLHGKSENNENGKQIGFARKFASSENYGQRPCLILAPLCYQPHGATGGGWDDVPGEETLELVKQLVEKLPLVDPKRVYVLGYSMGGFGTWHFLKEEPRLFAAGIPIAGGARGVGKLREMPIWSFHGAKDKVVPPDYARNCADELKRSKVFKYTEFPEEGHGIAGKVVSDGALHEWLFAQKRE